MPDPAAPAVVAPVTPAPDTAIPSAGTPLLAGKFKDAAALEAGYKALESKLGEKGVSIVQEPAKPSDGSLSITPDATPAEVEIANLDSLMDKAGIDKAAAAKHWQEHGKLSDEDYAKASKFNKAYGKAVVNELVEGRVAKAALVAQAITTAIDSAATGVGGRPQLDNLIEWAKTNDIGLSAAERLAVDKQLKDPATVGLAVRTLASLHREAMGAGKATALVGGQPNAAVGGGAKNSREFSDLSKLAAQGDKAAAARCIATPPDMIRSWTR